MFKQANRIETDFVLHTDLANKVNSPDVYILTCRSIVESWQEFAVLVVVGQVVRIWRETCM